VTGLTSVADALALINDCRPPAHSEQVHVKNALGRRLAAPVLAKVARPPANMSAMDGYAVRLEDVDSENVHLNIIGEAPAGRPFDGTVTPGTAVRVFTGSVIPSGADHVIIQENTKRNGHDLLSLEAYDRPRHIRMAGLDFDRGDTVLDRGTVLRSEHLAVLAAANNAIIDVETRPTVGMLANGDELRPPGSVLAPGEIINSNPLGLAGLIEQWGGTAIDLGTAGDNRVEIKNIIAAANVDILLPIGGASVGDHDHMRQAFAETGFVSIFEKVAVRPGKPTWFAKSGSKLVLGLPGNPASSLVCAHLFLAPLLGHATVRSNVHGRLLTGLPENGPREHFMRARARLDGSGCVEVEPAIDQDSSLLTPFTSCNALIRRMSGAAVEAPGNIVLLRMIGPLLDVNA